MKSLIPLTVVCTLVGCASTPPDPALSRRFVPVEAHQTSDLQLSCTDLSSQIRETDDAISALDKQIARAQQDSNSFSVMSALAGVSGAFAGNALQASTASAERTVANTGAALSANQAYTTKDLRVMYENRHEALMQLYYSRSCKS
jgi:DNA segregation ATPase FtsK/SpoIIIE-like protein